MANFSPIIETEILPIFEALNTKKDSNYDQNIIKIAYTILDQTKMVTANTLVVAECLLRNKLKEGFNNPLFEFFNRICLYTGPTWQDHTSLLNFFIQRLTEERPYYNADRILIIHSVIENMSQYLTEHHWEQILRNTEEATDPKKLEFI